MIISIDGLPGIGKTTLAKRLCRRYKARFIPEIYLPNLSRCDYDESAFIQNDIYKIHDASNLNPAFMDRSFCSTVCFKMAATKRIDRDSFITIQQDFYANEHIMPDLMIILLSPPSISLRGLEKRGEQGLFCTDFLEKWWYSFMVAATVLSDLGVKVRCIPSTKTPLYRSFIRDTK